jgi:hypothetical protein
VSTLDYLQFFCLGKREATGTTCAVRTLQAMLLYQLLLRCLVLMQRAIIDGRPFHRLLCCMLRVFVLCRCRSCQTPLTC